MWCMGVYVLLPEQGFVVPGDVVIGHDPLPMAPWRRHRRGARMCAGIVTGEAWFKVPQASA